MIYNYTDKLNQRKFQHLYRHRKVSKPIRDNKIIYDGKPLINFSSNDYLGLNQHPKIMEAMVCAAHSYGCGSGASPYLTGYSDMHLQVEEGFAQWLGCDRALLFNSGYMANLGILSSLVNRESTVLIDRLSHSSILDGIHLSRAKYYRYQHNNIEHLQSMIDQCNPDYIVTESNYSMRGDYAPIDGMRSLCNINQAQMIIDDAHGIGVLGERGGGAIEQFSLTQDDFACVNLPLGKAFNAQGAVIVGRAEVVDYIIQYAKSYGYSTALSPIICAAILATLPIVQSETWRRERLQKQIRYFIAYAKENNIPLASTEATPIKCIPMIDSEIVMQLRELLITHGFMVSAIRPPTVPKGQACIRISLNALHTESQIEQLLNLIQVGLKCLQKK